MNKTKSEQPQFISEETGKPLESLKYKNKFKALDLVNYDNEDPDAIALVCYVSNADYHIFDYKEFCAKEVEICGFDSVAKLCREIKPNYKPEDVAFKKEKYSKYFRDISHLEKIDIYRFLDLFNVTDHAIGHAIKKLVIPGIRTGGKTTKQDLEEAMDTIKRKLEMMEEDDNFSRDYCAHDYKPIDGACPECGKGA